jgi:uncharacterized protein with HEPN domain
MKKDDRIYLKHILDAISQIEEYTHKISHQEFVNKKMIQDAVIRQIEIIGEATKQLSPNIIEKYIQVPRKKIAQMKDKLIHYYMGVDIEIVWATVNRDVPLLKNQIESILKDLK